MHQPLVSMLLIAYRQPDTIARAIRAALAQTYSPLEIIASDDASDDATFEAMQAALAGYQGPHRIVLNRNSTNLGIGAHLSHLVGMSSGECCSSQPVTMCRCRSAAKPSCRPGSPTSAGPT